MVWELGPYRLDAARRELRRGHEPVSIEPKPLALLIVLAQNHPAPLSHEALTERLWPDLHVTPSSLTRAVGALRSALGERAESRGLVRTVHGYGYRLDPAACALVNPEEIPSRSR
ncbi:MAG: transcriptional regulator [Myxococcota bacterium]